MPSELALFGLLFFVQRVGQSLVVKHLAHEAEHCCRVLRGSVQHFFHFDVDEFFFDETFLHANAHGDEQSQVVCGDCEEGSPEKDVGPVPGDAAVDEHRAVINSHFSEQVQLFE